MKPTRQILLLTIATMIALPITAFAKGEKKKAAAPVADFATLDKDGNGTLSESEFVAAMKDKQTEEAAKTQFGSLDKDHDSKLTKDELAAASGKKKGKKKNASN